MSGFFSAAFSEIESLAGGVPAATAQNFAATAMQSLGGVPGLMQKFQDAGLGAHVASWIGSGSNLPISADDITRVFTPEQIEAFAEQHGVPAGVAAGLLAQILPHAVDAATPAAAAPAATTGDDDSNN